MDKLKRFIDCYIDTETCNLQCHYCYIAQMERFNKKLAKFGHTPDEIRKALSVERLGGKCLINLCAGGETLLSTEVIPVVKALLEEGHYVMIVTNGTMTNRFKEIAQLPKELLERLFFKFSFHYLELLRLNFMDKYFDNVLMMHNSGCSFTVEITPSDELIPHIEDIKKVCMEKLGDLCHITIARDDRTDEIIHLSKYDFDEYKNIWGQFKSELFDFKSKIFYKKRKEFCYAGDWSVYINLTSGDMKKCYFSKAIDNIYTNIDEPLKFEAVGCNCQLAHCYNGHAYLALGDIPEAGKDVTYASLRNGETEGQEWLKPKMKEFMSQKLYDNNEEYSCERKKQINEHQKINKLKYSIKRSLVKIDHKLKIRKKLKKVVNKSSAKEN